MTNSTNDVQKRSCCISHTFWTWILAILLTIYLYWHWQHGHGPARAAQCCAGASISAIVPAPAPVAESSTAFNFTASNAHGYNATGDASNVAWAPKSADMNAWFKGGNDWVIIGDASNVTLTGNVDSEVIKQAKGAEAQAFFGPGVTVDNQLMVKVAEAAPVTTTSPPAAKIYFNSGIAALPADASQTLATTVEWLKSNISAKAVISGFSDPRGNLTKNEDLSKNRAKAVREMLKSAGIDGTRIEMRKPEAVEAGGNLAEARRVEVSVE
jgi:outer membrane protein OmpA-like peptidoglycan-associated protein